MSDTEQQTSGIPPPKRVMSVVSTGSRLKAKLKKMELEHKRKLVYLDSSYMKQIRQCEADILVHQTSMGDYTARKMEILGITVENRSPENNEVLQNILDSERETIFKIKITKQKIEQLNAELKADKNAATTDFELEYEIVKQDDDDAASQRLSSSDESEVKSQDGAKTKKKKLKTAKVETDDDDSELSDMEDNENSKMMLKMMKCMGKSLGKALNKNQRNEKIIVNSNVDKDLPIYDGTPEQWISFKCQFERSTKKHKFDDSDNLYRLQKALKGKAMEAVRYLFNTPDNVDQIMTNLEMEFGRPELIIESLIRTAEGAENPNLNKPESIVVFARCVQSLVVSIKGHKQDDYLNNIHLLNKLTEKLPPQLRREWIQWYKSQPKQIKNMESFEKWITIQKEMACEMVKVQVPEKTEERGSGSRHRRGSGSANSGISESEEKKKCEFCQRSNHMLDTCRGFKKISLNDKWSFVKAERICFCCLKGNHLVRNCPNSRQCGKDNCDKLHNRILHADRNDDRKSPPPSPPPEVESDGEQNEGVAGAALIEGADGPLGIVPVKIRGPNGVRQTYALLDSGATCSFIDEKLAAELGIRGKEKQFKVTGIMGNVTDHPVQSVSFDVAGTYKGASYSKMTEVNSVTNMGFRPYSVNVEAIKRKWPHLKKMKMDNLKNAVVEVLIGEDHGFITMQRQVLFKDDTAPVGKRTKLGWFVSGKIKKSASSGRMYHASGWDEVIPQSIVESFKTLDAEAQFNSGDTKQFVVKQHEAAILEAMLPEVTEDDAIKTQLKEPDVDLKESTLCTDEKQPCGSVAIYADSATFENNLATVDSISKKSGSRLGEESMLPTPETFSSLTRLTHYSIAVVIAGKRWSRGRKNKLKSPWSSASLSSSVSAEDLEKDEVKIMRMVYGKDFRKASSSFKKRKLRNLSPFLDENGIIGRRRIDAANLNKAVKRPAILLFRHYFIKLLISHEKDMNAYQWHRKVLSKLRQRYGIGTKEELKEVLKAVDFSPTIGTRIYQGDPTMMTAVFPGGDGQVRVVEVTSRDIISNKTATFCRPVSKIFPLELVWIQELRPKSGAGMLSLE